MISKQKKNKGISRSTVAARWRWCRTAGAMRGTSVSYHCCLKRDRLVVCLGCLLGMSGQGARCCNRKRQTDGGSRAADVACCPLYSQSAYLPGILTSRPDLVRVVTRGAARVLQAYNVSDVSDTVVNDVKDILCKAFRLKIFFEHGR